MKYTTILLFGPPGSGKGTWGNVLGAIPGFLHISSGDMFRSLDRSTEVGALCASYIDKGELVPDDVTVKLSQEHIERLMRNGVLDPEKTCLLLDGLPRNKNQAAQLDDLVRIKAILCLDCPDRGILYERLRGRAKIEGRTDDANEETIRRRFEVYDMQTADTLSHYPPELVDKIDVSIPVQEILLKIASTLVARLKT